MIISIDNKMCLVSEATPIEYAKISRFLTVKVDGAEFSDAYDNGWDGRARLFVKNKFPTGLLPFIVNLLADSYIEFLDNRVNRLEAPTELVTELKYGWTLRDYQETGVKLPTYNKLNNIYFPRGIINYATNAGKESVITALTMTYDTNTLVLVHRKELFQSIVKFFKSCGIETSRYGGRYKELGKVTVAMYKTLYNKRKDPDVTHHLSKVSLLIVDECHRASADTYRTLVNYVNAFSVVYFSGTALEMESDMSKIKIMGDSGMVLGSITNKELVESGYSQKPYVIRLNYPTYIQTFENYYDECERLKFSGDRLNALTKYLEMYPDDQTLIVVKDIDHGEFLLDNLIHLPFTVDFVQGTDANRDEKIDNFRHGKCRVLISTMIFKEGISIPSIHTVVLAFGGKSKIDILQIIGRALRHDNKSSYCKIVDFDDQGDNLTRHTIYRRKLYASEGFDFIDVDLDTQGKEDIEKFIDK